MIFQNSIVRFIAFFIPVKDMRENFVKLYSRQTKYAKLREDNKRLFKENKSIINRISRLENLLNETRAIQCGFPSIIKPLADVSITKPPVTLEPVYLSIACIAKNEAPYIREWIEYHKIVGVERFYFYDNESTDNTIEVLEPYINDGTVIYHRIDGRSRQSISYTDAVFRYSNQTYWLALIDLDEFIVPKKADSVVDFLREYEHYPGVVINWVIFDSNGHDKKPTEHGGLVTANYTRVRNGFDKWHGERHIKSIVHPNYVAKIINPHFALYKNGGNAVSENSEPVAGPWSPYCSISKIQLNHYHTKSKEEYLKKIERGRHWTDIKQKYEESAVNFPNSAYDTSIQKYLPALKEAMGLND